MSTATCTACRNPDAPARPQAGFELPLCDACAAVRAGRMREPAPGVLAGVVGGFRAVVGRAPVGESVPRGALPWWWCYGRQPVYVHGARYNWSSADDGQVRRVVGEAEAARRYFAAEICAMDLRGEDATETRAQLARLTGMSARQIKRRAGGRR